MNRPGFRAKPEPTRAQVVQKHNHLLRVAVAGEQEIRRLRVMVRIWVGVAVVLGILGAAFGAFMAV